MRGSLLIVLMKQLAHCFPLIPLLFLEYVTALYSFIRCCAEGFTQYLIFLLYLPMHKETSTAVFKEGAHIIYKFYSLYYSTVKNFNSFGSKCMKTISRKPCGYVQIQEQCSRLNPETLALMHTRLKRAILQHGANYSGQSPSGWEKFKFCQLASCSTFNIFSKNKRS